jgi:predicted metal-dependent hydrolase
MNIQEPERLSEVREKYRTLREHLKQTNNEEFKMLCKEIPITAHRRMNGSIGYNVSKGSDIGLCIDGEPNEIFHVLIHELAHCTVDEYSHSKEFWKKFDELRTICVSLGIYRKYHKELNFVVNTSRINNVWY